MMFTYLCTEVGLHCCLVDKVLSTVNAIELSETGLVQVHGLIDELDWSFADVLVDLARVIIWEVGLQIRFH